MGIAHELVTRGWIQGAMQAGDGAVCLQGAINCSIFGAPRAGPFLIADDIDTETLRRYLDAYSTAERTLGQPVDTWNDAEGRTFDEVLRVAKELDEVLA